MASRSQRHRTTYLANTTVLLAHQIDAAYWQEWELFALPGGVQLFVLLNVPIVLVALLGFEQLGTARGRRCSYVLAGGGVFAGVFHAAHLLCGDEAFRRPVSLLLLALTTALSPFQLALARTIPDR